MGRVVWKYPLIPTGADWVAQPVVPSPATARVLCVGEQDGGLLAWIEVDPAGALGPLSLIVRGTGHNFDADGSRYVGTAFVGPFVWHVYEASTTPTPEARA